MPETYTGTEGDDALAAGLSIMDGGEDADDIDLAINRARDYVVWARDQAKAYADSLFAAISLAWDNITDKPATFPPSAHTHSSLSTGPVSFGWNGVRWNTPESISAAAAVFGGDVSVGGHVRVPNATPATSGYTIAYIDGPDGRLSRGASSIKYKDLLNDPDVSTLGDVFPTLRAFTMKRGDGTVLLGNIAEELAAHPDQERFVIYGTAPDGAGGSATTDDPESIDFIQMFLVQIAVLNARDKQRQAEITEMRGLLAELEARP